MGADAQLLDSFLGQYLLPLVQGGAVHVGPPLDTDGLADLITYVGLRDQTVLTIEAWLHQRAAELWLYAVQPRLTAELLNLAVASHNLLFMSHPSVGRLGLGRRGLARVAAFTAGCLERPRPRTDAELVARHALLGNLPRLSRTDVEIGFWIGRRSFVGQQPPERLLRWRQLRRVREQVTEVTWIDSELTELQAPLARRLLLQTPLTDLLNPQRQAPPFSWLPLYHYLASPWISRLACHHYLEQGLDAMAPALAQAFWRLVDDAEAAPRQEQALGAVVGLVAYLVALSYLDQEPAAEQDASQPPIPSATLESVLVAAARCGLVPPAGLASTEVQARFNTYVAAAQQTLGQAAEPLNSRLYAALSG